MRWFIWLLGSAGANLLISPNEFQAQTGDSVCLASDAYKVCTIVDDVLSPVRFNVSPDVETVLVSVADGDHKRARYTTRRIAMEIWSDPEPNCFVNISFPAVASSFIDPGSLNMHYNVDHCHVNKQMTLRLLQHKDDASDIEISLPCSSGGLCGGTLVLSTLEYGTHALSLELIVAGKTVLWSDDSVHTIVFDVVPPSIPLFKATYPSPILDSTTSRRNQRIGFIGSLDYDGQKSIWIPLMDTLKEFADVSFFSFTRTNSDKLLTFLKSRSISLHHFLLEMKFKTPPRNPSAKHLMEPVLKQVHSLIGYPQSNSDRQCSKRLYERIYFYVSPYAVEILVNLVGCFQGLDIAVIANSKSDHDAFLVACLFLSGVGATIMELPNPSPSKLIPNEVTMVAPSLHTLSTIESPNVKSYVISPGVNTSRFFPVPKMNSGKATIGYVGRLAPEKSIGLFIRMAAFLNDMKFVIVGFGPMRDSLQLLAKELNVHVEFVGSLWGDELVNTMRSFDLIVQPTIRGVSAIYIRG